MNYEFAHPCDDAFINKMDQVGKLDYFLVCIGHLNYLHTRNKQTIEEMRSWLSGEKIVLHALPEDEMTDILLFPETIPFQKLHGNVSLHGEFLQRNRSAYLSRRDSNNHSLFEAA